jgi:hypothetical protein
LKSKRVALAAATTVVALNIWTGAPLLAVWTGSRVAGSSGLSMAAIFVVVVVLAVSVIALAQALTRMSAKYDQLTGRPAAARRTSPWLRSLRGEREEHAQKRYGISAVERIVVISVAACVITFEVWFFFFSGSSLPHGT